jgi:hypothetical protein
VCELEGADRCDIYSRLVVALPELDTALGWRLITRGANAAHELPTMLALIEARAGGASFVPGRMRIDERRGVKDGQVVRFVVPTLDLGVGYLAMSGARQALPPAESDAEPLAYQPATRTSPGLDEALGAVTAARSDLGGNLPELPDPDVAPEPAPDPPDDGTIEPPDTGVIDEPPPKPTEPMIDTRQRKKLNTLVGQLRDKGKHITTEDLYLGIGTLRDQQGDDLMIDVGGVDVQGVAHWSPLRETLTHAEADQLIEWLTKKGQRVIRERERKADADIGTPA